MSLWKVPQGAREAPEDENILREATGVPALLKNLSEDGLLPTHVSDSISMEMDRVETATVRGSKFPSGGFPSTITRFPGHCIFGQRGIMFVILTIFALWWCKYPSKVPGGVLEYFRLGKVGKTSTARKNEPRPLLRSAVTSQPLSRSPRGGGNVACGYFIQKLPRLFSTEFGGQILPGPGGQSKYPKVVCGSFTSSGAVLQVCKICRRLW